MGNFFICSKDNKEDSIRRTEEIPIQANKTNVNVITSGAVIKLLQATKEDLAAAKITRFIRNATSRKKQNADLEWHIFSHFDTIDDADMVGMAEFTETLLSLVDQNIEALEPASIDQLSVPADLSQVVFLLNKDGNEDVPVSLNENDFFSIKKQALGEGAINEVDLERIIDFFQQKKKISPSTIYFILSIALHHVFKRAQTLQKVSIKDDETAIVVGDLHGQLTDLLYILESADYTNQKIKFIFNGDLIDRGHDSIEVLMMVLLLVSVKPNNFYVNRGNHEDGCICQDLRRKDFNFQRELLSKYPEEGTNIFKQCCYLFTYLPLFTLLNDTVFIVHGGLFSDNDVSMQELAAINRAAWKGVHKCESGSKHVQLQTEALWSDPDHILGISDNVKRKAGILFGPDQALNFMNNNNIDMVIRSHEVIKNGYKLAYDDKFAHVKNTPRSSSTVEIANDYLEEGLPLLYTLFSASNYTQKGNAGAFLELKNHEFCDSTPAYRIVGKENNEKSARVYYKFHSYSSSSFDISNVRKSNEVSMIEFIQRHKKQLRCAFQQVDTKGTRLITRTVWSETMMQVTQLRFPWIQFIPVFSAKNPEAFKGNQVNYDKFLEIFSIKTLSKNNENGDLLEEIYADRDKIMRIFSFFDADNDGEITHAEFYEGCSKLNEVLPERSKLSNLSKIIELMDFDGNGTVSINEFMESIRLVESGSILPKKNSQAQSSDGCKIT